MELSVKTRGDRRLFLLVNHHGEKEEIELRLDKEASLRDPATGRVYPESDIIKLSLDGSTVLVLEEIGQVNRGKAGHY